PAFQHSLKTPGLPNPDHDTYCPVRCTTLSTTKGFKTRCHSMPEHKLTLKCQHQDMPVIVTNQLLRRNCYEAIVTRQLLRGNDRFGRPDSVIVD
ncbi:hypothetical protein, partial [Pseudomonas viridiflava]|uniref:hypothetical protein n=1 Tax=Pseudomonas viridiflava TaxID=33069 RepID=UPI0019D00363